MNKDNHRPNPPGIDEVEISEEFPFYDKMNYLSQALLSLATKNRGFYLLLTQIHDTMRRDGKNPSSFFALLKKSPCLEDAIVDFDWSNEIDRWNLLILAEKIDNSQDIASALNKSPASKGKNKIGKNLHRQTKASVTQKAKKRKRSSDLLTSPDLHPTFSDLIFSDSALRGRFDGALEKGTSGQLHFVKSIEQIENPLPLTVDGSSYW